MLIEEYVQDIDIMHKTFKTYRTARFYDLYFKVFRKLHLKVFTDSRKYLIKSQRAKRKLNRLRIQDIPEEDLDMLSKALFEKEYDNIDDMSVKEYMEGEDNGRK